MVAMILGIIIFMLICAVLVLLTLVKKMKAGMDHIYKKYIDTYNEMAKIKMEMR